MEPLFVLTLLLISSSYVYHKYTKKNDQYDITIIFENNQNLKFLFNYKDDHLEFVITQLIDLCIKKKDFLFCIKGFKISNHMNEKEEILYVIK
jgi:hypothetical protein